MILLPIIDGNPVTEFRRGRARSLGEQKRFAGRRRAPSVARKRPRPGAACLGTGAKLAGWTRRTQSEGGDLKLAPTWARRRHTG